MRSSLILVFFFLSFLVFSQNETKRTSNISVYKHWQIDFSKNDYQLELSRIKNHEAAPVPVMRSNQLKKVLDSKRKRTSIKSKSSYLTSPEDLTPSVESSLMVSHWE